MTRRRSTIVFGAREQVRGPCQRYSCCVVPPRHPGVGVSGGRAMAALGQARERGTATSISYDHSSLWTATGG